MSVDLGIVVGIIIRIPVLIILGYLLERTKFNIKEFKKSQSSVKSLKNVYTFALFGCILTIVELSLRLQFQNSDSYYYLCVIIDLLSYANNVVACTYTIVFMYSSFYCHPSLKHMDNLYIISGILIGIFFMSIFSSYDWRMNYAPSDPIVYATTFMILYCSCLSVKYGKESYIYSKKVGKTLREQLSMKLYYYAALLFIIGIFIQIALFSLEDSLPKELYSVLYHFIPSLAQILNAVYVYGGFFKPDWAVNKYLPKKVTNLEKWTSQLFN